MHALSGALLFSGTLSSLYGAFNLCILAFDQGAELVYRRLRALAFMMCGEPQHVFWACA